jgi:L-asparaginase
MADLPRVAWIATGGTIDSVGVDRLDLAWYLEAGKRLPEGELFALLPELEQVATVSEAPFRRIVSQAMTFADWIDLVNLIHGIFERDEADGIVISHGTNTLEETAYFLHLTLKTDQPVVIVGAMRPSSGLSADGYLNVLNAVRVAGDPQSRGKGVLVVLNDTIHSARDVTKTATYRVETFQDRDLGPLGYADADKRVLYYHAPVRPHTTATEFSVDALGDGTNLPRVDIVVSYVGADGTQVDAAVAAGAKAIVSAGTGAGRPTPGEDAALARARERGVLVCQATRVGSGRTVQSPKAKERGDIGADNLVPWKARILLTLGLVRTRDAQELQRLFDTY